MGRRRVWFWYLRSERGSQGLTAAGAALAAALIVGGLMSGAGVLGDQVYCAYVKAASVLSGGGAPDCAGGPPAEPGGPADPGPSGPGNPPPSKPQDQAESACDKAAKGVLDNLLPNPGCASNKITGTIKLNGDVTIPTPWGFGIKAGASDSLIVTREGNGNVSITVQTEGRAGATIESGARAEIETGTGAVGGSTPGGSASVGGNAGSNQTVKYNMNNPGEACAALQALAYLETKKAVLNSPVVSTLKPIINPLLDPLEQQIMGKDHWVSRGDFAGINLNGTLAGAVLKGDFAANGKATFARTPTGFDMIFDADGGATGTVQNLPLFNQAGGKLTGQYKLTFDNNGNLTKITLIGTAEMSGAPAELSKFINDALTPIDPKTGKPVIDPKTGKPVQPNVPVISETRTVGVKKMIEVTDPAVLAEISRQWQETKNPPYVLGYAFGKALTDDNAEVRNYLMLGSNNKYGFDIGVGQGTGIRLAANVEANSMEERLMGHYKPGQNGQPGEWVQPVGGCIG